jgi:hypothetical protein
MFNDAKVYKSEMVDATTIEFTLVFTGDAGEKTLDSRKIDLNTQGLDIAAVLKGWAKGKVAELNSVTTAKQALSAFPNGTTIDLK